LPFVKQLAAPLSVHGVAQQIVPVPVLLATQLPWVHSASAAHGAPSGKSEPSDVLAPPPAPPEAEPAG
jgi:hypothetical protein